MVEDFIGHSTYLGLFLTLFAAGMGLPIPEEVVIIAGGVLAHTGVARWWLALPACIAGVVGGDIVLYWVGHHWGERVLRWRIVRWVMTPEREAALLAAYRRHGVKIVFTARHVMGLRAAAFLTAGIAHVPFWSFLAVDAGASLVSVPVGFFLGYLATDQLERVLHDIHRLERWLIFIALVAAVTWALTRLWRWGRRSV